MKSANASASGSTPQNAFSLSLPTILPNPVPGASTNTRSLTSSRLYALSTSRYGAAGVCESSAVTTRRGPNAPMCSHTVAEPGPPLYRNITGRVASAPVWKYATYDIAAAGGTGRSPLSPGGGGGSGGLSSAPFGWTTSVPATAV